MTAWVHRIKRWASLLAVLAVAGIALWLRLRAAELLPIDYDEDDYLRAGQQYADAFRAGDWGAVTRLNYRPEHPPLAKLLFGAALAPLPQAAEIPDRPTTAGPARLLPQPHLKVARRTAAVTGALEVLVLALVSPLAGLFLAGHTFTIKYTSQVMLEALPALTSLAAIWCYLRSRRRLNGWLLLSALALGLTASAKYMYCVAGVAVAVHWAWQTWRRADEGKARWRGLGALTLWAGLSLAFFFASDPYLWPDPSARLRESVFFHAQYTQSDAVQQANLPAWQSLVWLFQSVPWHPGVFVVALDGLIALLALVGLRRLWRKQALFGVWLAVGLLFLFVWPTKWPQYILLLTAPLSLAAAEGFTGYVWEPLVRAWRRLRAGGLGRPRFSARVARRGLGRALPWLLPGTAVLLLITFFPLLYQGGIALTDFNTTSIKDGINGGIWREVRAGLSGRVEPADFSNIFSMSRSPSKQVHYVGPRPFLLLVTSGGADVLVFEVLWTLLSVGLQTALGVGVALLLHRPGVRLKGWWQTLFILPWAIPEFVGALVWMQVFDPRYGWFFLGTSFPNTPGHPVAQGLATWQQNPNAALAVLLLAATWVGFPLIMLAASAGLKMVPAEVYDAAAIDGANARQRFRAITWPLLLPLLAPALILRGIFAFNQFYLFYVLEAPYPLMTFASLSYVVFDAGGKYAVSAMINLLTVLLLVVFLLAFNRWSRAGEGVTYA